MRFILLLSLCSFVFAKSGLPTDFIFGAATASYQIEGAVGADGREPSIWDIFSHMPGKTANGDTGDVADDSYHRYPEDIALLASLGVSFYRFSISWSRVIHPSNNSVNLAGVAYYNKVLDELDKYKIRPFVTLYHWDLPWEYSEMKPNNTYQGWLSADVTARFIEYARTCFDHFGNRVKHWLTFNEPKTFCLNGYGIGNFAPGRCSNRTTCDAGDSTTEPYLCTHNVLLAHAQVVSLYHARYAPYQGGVIGITLNGDWAEPFSSSSKDVAAAQRNLEFQLAWFADPLYFGDYPESMKKLVGSRLPQFTQDQRSLLTSAKTDFFGLNHYTSRYVQDISVPVPSRGWDDDQACNTTVYNSVGQLIGAPADSSWLYVVPWGFRSILKWISDRYSRPPIFITENGVDCPNESSLPLAQALQDDFRINYYSGYINAMTDAITRDNVDVRGYFVWSLLDNFEWADGYTKRFGIHYVDYANERKRYAKASAAWYRQLISQHNNPSMSVDHA